MKSNWSLDEVWMDLDRLKMKSICYVDKLDMNIDIEKQLGEL